MRLYTILIFTLIKRTLQQPNIILIVADDLGWNDVGFHGSSEIPTPNIDALAYTGLILNNYYVTPICTPSRSALMTGKYPIHTGMQHGVLYGAEPRGLPLDEKILPQVLKAAGYVTRIVGKWHLGSYKKEYTPLFRGFDSHLGFWTGHQDYFDHTAVERPGWGLDMRRDMDVAYDLHGQYSTDVFTDEAKRLIQQHNVSKPLFLYLAHAAVHSGNPYEPLRAPDETLKKFSYIQDFNRRRFAAMLSKLDDSVGVVVETLKQRQMLNNSIIVFTTDNGGAAGGFNLNAASNYPLRGVKNTLWEGGVRGAALLWSTSLQQPSRVAQQLMHISDWYPTLLQAAGIVDNKTIDGINLWDALSNNTESPRSEILHNIDDIYGNAALTVGHWKMMKGTTYNGSWDDWYGPAGRNYTYNTTSIVTSPTGQALRQLGITLDPHRFVQLRKSSTIECSTDISKNNCRPLKETCLFNILSDPCELQNVANKFPKIVAQLEKTLNQYNSTALPPGNQPLDPRGDPKNWHYVWTNFGDFLDNQKPTTVLI